MNYSVKAILDRRRLKTDNTFPIKIQVYLNGEKHRYATKYSLTDKDWLKLNNFDDSTPALKKIKKKLDNIVLDAENILGDLDPLTKESFEREFFKEVHRNNDKILFWFNEYITDLTDANRPQSTIQIYSTALNSLLSFHANLGFADITPQFLNQYENWMKSRGKSKATVGIYLRHLRSIFNYVIYDKKVIKADIYPFGKKKYIIKTKSRKKQGLTFEQVKLLESYNPEEGSSLQYARDMWLFHYLLNGSNTKDVCRLKYSDLDLENSTFSFYRAKTENTESDVTPISGILHEKAKKIIDIWGNKNHSGFVFPFFNEFTNVKIIDAKRERTILGFVRKRINRNLSAIQKELGFTVKLTTAIARHSLASILNETFKREDISEVLGHQSVKTTANYINSIDNSKKKQISNSLL